MTEEEVDEMFLHQQRKIKELSDELNKLRAAVYKLDLVEYENFCYAWAVGEGTAEQQANAASALREILEED